MIIIIETVILCIAFFLICFWGTGTDNKNLKSYSSYPDEVQNRIKSIAEYQGKFKESNKVVTFRDYEEKSVNMIFYDKNGR